MFFSAGRVRSKLLPRLCFGTSSLITNTGVSGMHVSRVSSHTRFKQTVRPIPLKAHSAQDIPLSAPRFGWHMPGVKSLTLAAAMLAAIGSQASAGGSGGNHRSQGWTSCTVEKAQQRDIARAKAEDVERSYSFGARISHLLDWRTYGCRDKGAPVNEYYAMKWQPMNNLDAVSAANICRMSGGSMAPTGPLPSRLGIEDTYMCIIPDTQAQESGRQENGKKDCETPEKHPRFLIFRAPAGTGQKVEMVGEAVTRF